MARPPDARYQRPLADPLCSNGIPIAAGTALALIVHGSRPTWVTNWPTLLTAGAAISVATVISGVLLTWMIPAGRPLVRDAVNALCVRSPRRRQTQSEITGTVRAMNSQTTIRDTDKPKSEA